ncbi:hypothetical protein ACHAXA_005068 [Cyclostephanos tholiformis]|uniref:Uncharacterized protein n=1 Tax=Cyclostephanos tholiformis TaxID=382380 RepID=A0ABD3SRY8_9STRA
MAVNSVDASNACIPPSHPLIRQALPLPSTNRGEPLFLDGDGGRWNDGDDDGSSNGKRRPLVMYGFGKLVVIREIDDARSLSSSSSAMMRDGEDNDDDLDEGCHTDPTGTRESTGGFVYRGHAANVTCAKFSPSGKYVASCDHRGRLRIWSYDHGEHLTRLEVQLLSGPIRDVCWDHECRRVVVAGDGGAGSNSDSCRVIMWDTGVKCGELSCHARRRASSCAYRPRRPMKIATGGSEDATVYFHSGPPFRRVIPGENDVVVVDERCHERGAVHCLRYNRDGSLLASAGTDGSVCIYDGGTMKSTIRLIRAHDSSVYSCSWDRSGNRLLTCGADGYARLYDGNTGTKVREWDVASSSSYSGGGGRTTTTTTGKDDGSSSTMRGMSVAAMQLGCTFIKGNVPISVGYDGQIAVLSPLDDDGPIVFITGHQAPISAMTFGAPGDDTVYTADTDGVIVEWDVSTGRARGRVVSDVVDDDGANATPASSAGIHAGANVTSLAFVVNDKGGGGGDGGILYSAGWDDHVRMTHGRTCHGKARMEAQPNAMTVGSTLVVVMTVGGLLLIERERLVSELIPLPYEATCVCLSNDDATLYVGGNDRNIHIYAISSRRDVNLLEEVHVITGGHLHPVQSLSLSPDCTMLAAADVRDVCVYSTTAIAGSADDHYSTLVPKGRWCFHSQRIGCLAWSPDGNVIASGGNDDSIFLWCPTQKMKRVHYRFAHRGGVTGLGFVGRTDGGGGSSGDWTLVSAGADGCLNWWNVEDDVRGKFGL